MKTTHYFFLIALLLGTTSCVKKPITIVLDLLICETTQNNRVTEQQIQLLLPFEKDKIRYLAQGSLFNNKDTISYVKKKTWLENLGNVQKPLFSEQELISNHLKRLDLSSLSLEQPLSVDDIKRNTANPEYDFVLGFRTKQVEDSSPYPFKIFKNSKDILSYITDEILVKNPDAKILLVYNPPKNDSVPIDITLDKTSLELDKTSLEFEHIGATEQLTATVFPADAPEEDKKVIWQSDNPTVATVDSNGLVTAMANGDAVISAHISNGSSVTCYVAVEGVPVAGVTLDKTALSLEKGKFKQLIVTVNPKNATNKELVWKSDNETIVKVDATGLVTAIAKGKANITVTTVDGEKTATCGVTVGGPPLPGKTYSFGKYSGSFKNGIPDGQGTMYYSKSVRVAKHAREKYCAEAGDTFVGLWGNGDIVNGELRDKDNNVKAVILAGKRPNPYNIENDGRCE